MSLAFVSTHSHIYILDGGDQHRFINSLFFIIMEHNKRADDEFQIREKKSRAIVDGVRGPVYLEV